VVYKYTIITIKIQINQTEITYHQLK